MQLRQTLRPAPSGHDPQRRPAMPEDRIGRSTPAGGTPAPDPALRPCNIPRSAATTGAGYRATDRISLLPAARERERPDARQRAYLVQVRSR